MTVLPWKRKLWKIGCVFGGMVTFLKNLFGYIKELITMESFNRELID